MVSEAAISDFWTAITNARENWGENMGLGYDIFRESSDGSPLWVAQAATLKEAEEKVNSLARSGTATYFIRDAARAKIVGRVGPKNSEKIKS